jgi:AraC family transcriptional regulator, regulatory protein of adaptative response / DNA-3-methyladenine glycosylase II
MVLDADAAYLALKARDARFDGRLFVGVTSTGVYCRPVCRVRTPRRENCRFFPSAAQAEAQHFRPCLKCRPEVAPGLSFTDSSRSLADSAARLIEQAVHEGDALAMPALGRRLGVTDRHLRRIFQAQHGVSPLDYLTTQRLLLAKQLLTDTTQAVTQVALASGFASVRRFNAAFAERYRFSPTRLRREGAAEQGLEPTRASLRLAYRPPYDAAALLGFFAQRAVRGLEHVDGLTLRRTLTLPHRGAWLAGWLTCRFVPERNEVRVDVAPGLAPVLGAVLRRARHALDLDADPALIEPVLAGLPGAPGTRLPGTFDGFEVAVRIVLGQQVTVKGARTLIGRLVERFGTPVETPFAGLDRLFPSAEVLAAADPELIGRLGIVRQRVRALQALSQAVARGELPLHRGAPLDAALDALRALPGIGEWTVQVIAMRAFGWPDAFPATDIGVCNALGTRDPRLTAQRAEAWRPWRAYAVLRLWQGLEHAKGTLQP